MDGSLLGLCFFPKAKTGRPRVDDALVIDGILYVLVKGCRWIYLLSMFHVRLCEKGLSVGASKAFS